MCWRFISCFIKHHAMKTYWGSGGIGSCILNFSTPWRWVVSLMPQLFYPWVKSYWNPLNRKLGGPQIQSGHGGDEKALQHCPSWELNPDHPAHNKYFKFKWECNFKALVIFPKVSFLDPINSESIVLLLFSANICTNAVLCWIASF